MNTAPPGAPTPSSMPGVSIQVFDETKKNGPPHEAHSGIRPRNLEGEVLVIPHAPHSGTALVARK